MRDVRFTFLCDRAERDALATLARRLDRTEGDTVRLLIRGAARELLPGQPPAGVTEGASPEPSNG